MTPFWTTSLVAIFCAYVALMIGMRALRRVSKRAEKPLHTDFSIDELHQMLIDGKLRPDEYERLKEVVLANRAPLARKLDPAALEMLNRPASGRRGFDVIPPPRDEP
jgi:hypothetical protein